MAANTLMSLMVKLGVDNSDFKKGLDSAEQSAASTAQNISSKFTSVGQSMMKGGAMMTAGITAPIALIGTQLVSAASDLEESANAVNVVFLEGAGIIDNYGKTAASTVGLAESEFNQLSAVTGAFLKNLGFDVTGAAKETINLTERASDMASIFNTDVSQALAAIQSGLKGEFNPLESFGVKMNAAMIEAKALEMGLGDLEGKVDDNAKAQAALALIYEQTDQFAGDFLNTSDGLANSQRILKAELKDVSASLGTQLLPYVLDVVKWISGLVDKLKALTPEQQKWILGIAALLAVIGPAVTIIGALSTAIGAIIPIVGAVAAVLTGPVLIAVAAVIAVIALLALAWETNFFGIRDTLTTWWESIKLIWQAVQAAIDGDWTKVGELLRAAWDNIWNLIEKRIDGAKDFIKNGIANLIDTIKSAFQIDWSILGKRIIDGLISGIKNGIGAVGQAMVNVAKNAMSAFQGFMGIHSDSKLMEQFGKNTISGYLKGLNAEGTINIAKVMEVPGASAVQASTTAASGSSGLGNNITVNVTNPKKETAEESIRKVLKGLSYTGAMP